DLGAQGVDLYYVTPGGRSFLDIPDPVQRGAALTFRLAVRNAGRTEDAGLVASSVQVDATPAAAFDVVEQAGGQWINLIPRAILAAGTDYTIRVRSGYRVDGVDAGAVDKTFGFRTVSETVAPPALAVGANETSAFEIRNLAPYQPPLIVSLNQIGFDSVDFLASVIDRRGDDFILWMTAAVPGENRVDPATTTKIAMDGTLDGTSFILDGANLQLVTGGPPIDVRSFRIASQFDAAGAFDGGTSVVAQAGCLDLGAVGIFLLLFDLCNTDGDFVSVGTIRGETFDGAPNRRPAGVTFTGLTREGTTLTAHFTADGYPLAAHSPAIVLVDDVTGKAVNVNYRTALSALADAEGDLASVTLTGAPVVPGRTRAIIVTDLFPIASVLVE
ncbi:MAG: hypothetical protein KC466_09705, partial [Myxococcales bacterium]|nr:hypothetical protein [Myxococcales bacterium]